MSSTRLLILGVVRRLQPVHGYDVRRVLAEWDADAWSGVRSGSIYHALTSMSRDALLEPVDAGRVRGGRARIRYRLTVAGEREYQRRLHHQWWSYEPVSDPFLPAFSFVPDVPPVEAAAGLRHRADVLRDLCARLTDPLQRQAEPHAAEMVELVLARARAEIEWCERVAVRAGKGEFVPPASP